MDRSWRSAIPAVMAVAALLLMPPAASQQEETCLGRPATIVGTDDDDVIHGTPGDDVIVAGDGADIVYAKAGDDVICGGPGAEERESEDSGPYVAGDSLRGGSGDDEIDVGPGPNYADGDSGHDLLIGAESRDSLNGSVGDDVIQGNDEGDDLNGGPGNDTLEGGPGNDVLDGFKGIDRLLAGDGDDEIRPMQGADEIDGGEGTDLLNLFWVGESDNSLSSHRRDLTVDLELGTARGMGGDTLTGIEDVWGSSGHDVLLGDEGPNWLNSEDDQGISGEGNVLKGRGGDDILTSGQADDRIYGGEGRDLLNFNGNTFTMRVDMRAGTTSGEGNDRFWSIEDVAGTGGADVLIGDDDPNLLTGDYGKDVLRGGGGDDTLRGGRLRDVIDGGEGTDTCVSPTPAEGARNCEG